MMFSPENSYVPSTEYARDIEIFDAEPWNEHGAVDDLIARQKDLFQAELNGDTAKIASVTHDMAELEVSINNYSEAGAYAEMAAELFVAAGKAEDAIASYCVLANAHWRMGSLELGYDAWHQALELRSQASAREIAPHLGQVNDERVRPLVHQVASVLERHAFNAVRLPPNTTTQLFADLEKVLAMPMYTTPEATGSAMVFLSLAYRVLSAQKSLPREQRRLSKQRSKDVSHVEFYVSVFPHTALHGPEKYLPVSSILEFIESKGDAATKSRQRLSGK